MSRFSALTLVLSALLVLVGLGLVGPGLASQGGPSPSQLVLAVARFDDRSNSGLANVGEGVADLLIERLVNAGYRVVERQEIEAVLLERGLNPLLTGDLAQAARLVGADVLLIGSVTKVNIQESSLSLGFLTITGAKVTVDLAIRAVSAYTTEIMGASSVEAQAEGQTGFSLNLGQLLSALSGWRANVCTGGFLSDKPSYAQGEPVNFGYAPAAMGNYAISIYDGTGTNWIWGANYANLTPGACITFSWDQREFWWPRNLVPPGTYRAYLCNSLGCSPGDPSLIASLSFSIVIGAPPSWLNEITVGTKEFSGTIVGQAVNAALDKLVVELGAILQRIEPQVLAQRAQAAQPQPAERLKGRVIDIWADGTILLDLGRAHGVQLYDVFEVFDPVEVRDPNTGALIEVIPATTAPKGELVVSRVEERVSLANKLGDFPVKIGDLVIRKET